MRATSPFWRRCSRVFNHPCLAPSHSCSYLFSSSPAATPTPRPLAHWDGLLMPRPAHQSAAPASLVPSSPEVSAQWEFHLKDCPPPPFRRTKAGASTSL